MRDESAAARATAAQERDGVAAERDRNSAQRHGRQDLIGVDVAEAMRQAARDRETAAADRARSAADREAAARARDDARRALAEAAQQVEDAATDELTGAWTRRFGFEQTARELERANRTGSTLTLVFVDVDGLKEVNDHHGHAAGDRLLRLVAQTVRAYLRPYDVVVRYGGDEFVCALPHISRVAAEQRMLAIAAALSEVDPGHSISFGLAEHQLGEGLQQLIERADADLLSAKRARGKRT